MTAPLSTGPDGKLRCGWVSNDVEYVRYHDEEWGQPQRDDRALFEKVSLEGFQAGLSWLTILRKRAQFRIAFERFDPAQVASYGDEDVARLLDDAGIIRNSAKIRAVINNAQIVRDMEPGEFSALLWSFAPERPGPRTDDEEIPAITPESTALSRELRRRGFKFVGPTTMYALMQAVGMVNDHRASCWRATPAS